MKRSIFVHGFGIALAAIAGLAASAVAATSRIANFAIAMVREGFPPPDPRSALERLNLPAPRQIIGLPQARAFAARLLARAVDRFPRRDLSGLSYAA